MRKTKLLAALAAGVLLAAGCGGADSPATGNPEVPLDQRVTASPAEKPAAAPQVPETAKNIPKPE